MTELIAWLIFLAGVSAAIVFVEVINLRRGTRGIQLLLLYLPLGYALGSLGKILGFGLGRLLAVTILYFAVLILVSHFLRNCLYNKPES